MARASEVSPGILEQRGDLAGALQRYVAAGAVEDAARVLVAMRRPGDAARMILSVVGAQPSRNAESQRLAAIAARCLAESGDLAGAAAIFTAIGDHASAAALGLAARNAHQSASQQSPQNSPQNAVQAAYAARTAGDTARAAALFDAASMPYEAGVCWFEKGDLGEALLRLVRVGSSDRHYRAACVYAIHACARLGDLSFEVDQFLSGFATTNPETGPELQALYVLSALYERGGFEEEALEALRRVVSAAPDHADAKHKLAALEAKNATPHFDAAAVEQDMSFWAPAKPSAPPTGLTEATAPMTVPPVSGSAPRVSSANLTPGSTIASRYRITGQIGRGGMGVVYRAEDLELGEVVAIKVFSQRIDDPQLLARFKLELMICRSLAHPNIVRLYDIGAHEGRKFISMELLAGQTLKELVPLPVDRAIGFLLQLCTGLSEVHERGIVHRDLKPANLFVTEKGALKIMDFGLAKRPSDDDSDDTALTSSGFMAGTVGYMPPEQVTGFGSVTAAADMYAVGVVAYETLTGMRPFREKEHARVVKSQFTTVPEPPRSHAPQIPPALDDLIMRLLDRAPDVRPTCEETRAALESVRVG